MQKCKEYIYLLLDEVNIKNYLTPTDLNAVI